TTGTIVAIMTERSVEMIIGIFGILKAGAAYLPIDPNYPEERVEFMLKDSNAIFCISEMKPSVLPASSAVKSRPEPAPCTLHPDNLAYVIYTSGSTGKPKGVLIEHHSVVNRLKWMQSAYAIGERDVILQKTAFTFDVSVWELFWWSWEGARLCLLEPGAEKDPAGIVKAISMHNVSTMHFVPSMLKAFLYHLETLPSGSPGGIDRLKSLRQVFASGEALPVDQVERFNRLLHSPRLINLYGPTEATVDVSYYNCPSHGEIEKIPIGKPIDNTSLYIVDKYLRLQPVLVTGELCIGGAGLARGYLNRPQLTAERFISFSAKSAKSAVIYKTGDLARWLADGNIEFLGRIDHQVKIRGFRVELGEIESQLRAHPNLKEAVVVERKDGGRHYLCAYVVPAGKEKPPADRLKDYLKDRLPNYMVPAFFVELEAIPLSGSGKADRKQLPPPMESGVHAGGTYEAPGSGLQETIADVWREVLDREKVGITDNFFDLGGNSLDFVKISNKLGEKLGKEIPVATLFTYSTILSLELWLTPNREKEDPGDIPVDDSGMVDEGKDLMRQALRILDEED
ncbi:MAG: non-ribosomal peptide synthetase, partial [bacterium]|nr:non-ribosomal peptide synthetase [bacterium]